MNSENISQMSYFEYVSQNFSKSVALFFKNSTGYPEKSSLVNAIAVVPQHFIMRFILGSYQKQSYSISFTDNYFALL